MAVPFEPSAALEVQRAHRETLGRQQLVGNTHLLPGTHRPEDGQDGTRPVSHGSRKKAVRPSRGESRPPACPVASASLRLPLCFWTLFLDPRPLFSRLVDDSLFS